MQIVFIVNIGIKEGLIIKLAYLIRKNKIKSTRSIGLRSLKIFFLVSLLILFLMFMYIGDICHFFLTTPLSRAIFMDSYWVMFLALLADSLNMGLFTIIKAFDKDYSLLRYQLAFLGLEGLLAYLLGYRAGAGLAGLWYGWTIGGGVNLVCSWMMLVKYQNQRRRENRN